MNDFQTRVLIRQLQGALTDQQRFFKHGTGDPEGNVDAPQSAVYSREDTGDVYRKDTPEGTLTGWVAL